MSSLVLPKILDIPDKLEPITTELDNYRYFLIEGGRGGGKSQSVARLFLYLTEKHNVRVICGREVQNSISESVYSLMVDLIHQYHLGFTIQATKIISNITKSEINFRGFREQGRFSIQGIEGVTLFWIDEAQAITKQTLDVLIPTIRKDKAKIFFTMNRHIRADPVFSKFAKRDDCLHIHINYNENPFCTDALKKEAQECRLISEEDYNHIWLGYPLSQSEDAVFSREDFKVEKCDLQEGYGFRIAGFDIARYGDDKCVGAIIQQQSLFNWELVHLEQWGKKDLNYTTGRISSIVAEQKVSSSIIYEDGIGAGPLDTFTKGMGANNFVGFRNPPIGYKKNRFYINPRTVNAYKVKDLLRKGFLRITDEETIEEFLGIQYTFDNYQRKGLISKEKMRTKGVKSPNKADAIIMAVSLIGKTKSSSYLKNLPRETETAPVMM